MLWAWSYIYQQLNMLLQLQFRGQAFVVLALTQTKSRIRLLSTQVVALDGLCSAMDLVSSRWTRPFPVMSTIGLT